MLKNITEEELLKCGVYQIKCVQNNKIYIGSTVQTFKKRLNHHISMLKACTHKNKHLQNAYNKYGDFEISILEVCDRECALEREQYYLDSLLRSNLYIENKDSYFRDNGFNINPLATGTPNLSQETIDKRTKTFKAFVSEAARLYNEFKNFELDFDEIPEKYLAMIHVWMNAKPWNKGKKYESTEHLKVKKNIDDAFKENRKQQRINKMPKIEIYDLEGVLLKTFDNAKIIVEWSLTDDNKLPIVSRFKGKERMGVPLKALQYESIIKAIRTSKPYKGLIFKHATPLDGNV